MCKYSSNPGLDLVLTHPGIDNRLSLQLVLRPTAIREGYCHVGLNGCLFGLCMSHGPDKNARTQRFPVNMVIILLLSPVSFLMLWLKKFE